MAMHPQEWSIHALSVEFGINPNVVSRRLRDVQPCRSEGNLRWWRMSEAAPALSNPTRAGGDQSREDADRRRAIAEAEIAEAKAGQIKGDLVPVTGFATELERAFTAVRARLLAIRFRCVERDAVSG